MFGLVGPRIDDIRCIAAVDLAQAALRAACLGEDFAILKAVCGTDHREEEATIVDREGRVVPRYWCEDGVPAIDRRR